MKEEINVKVKKIHPDAIIPQYATDGSACFDLHSVKDTYVDDIEHSSEIIPTGLAFEIPNGHVMLIFSRSGHAFKHNVRLANCVAVIDADYRGEVKVKLAADLYGELVIKKGDRIAQAMIIPYPRVTFTEVSELNTTARGEGGFGSTGA